jgi:hypothetical protein
MMPDLKQRRSSTPALGHISIAARDLLLDAAQVR